MRSITAIVHRRGLQMVLCALVWVFGAVACKSSGEANKAGKGVSGSEPSPAAIKVARSLVLDAKDRQRVAEIVANSAAGAPSTDEASAATQPADQLMVHVGLWSRGRRLGAAWSKPDMRDEAVGSASRAAWADVPEVDRSGVDVAIVELAFDRRELAARAAGRQLANIRTGLWAAEFRWDDQVERIEPSHLLATNQKLSTLPKQFRQRHEMTREEFERSVEVARYDVRQLHVEFGAREGGTPKVGRVRAMFRGGRVVRPSEMDKAGVANLASEMTGWLERHLADSGRMTYNWDPTSSKETPDAGGRENNMIRQWMATNALIQVARQQKRDDLWPRIAAKIDYDLEHYYVKTERGGAIEYSKYGRKLGAMALATMAIMLHPERQRWAEHERGLRATIDSMWHEDGYFDAYSPARGDRNTNVQNFYPGECLLLWGYTYLETRDPDLLRRYMKSVEYYRRWHLKPEHRKPAFVPWHVQANYLVWTATRDKTLLEFNFEMSDWLLHMQQWDELAAPDLRGRFYNPKRARAQKDGAGKVIRPNFGGPHASATGVYMEGLIAAFAMAREVGDTERADRYRVALVRGARSLRQLQFRDELDMFFVTDRDMTRGGLRTTMYRQEIRVDNVQHGLMALLNMLEKFEASDFDTRRRPGG